MYNKAKHNRAMQKTHCTGQPTLRFGCLCWRRYNHLHLKYLIKQRVELGISQFGKF